MGREYFASSRAFCIADSIVYPEAEWSFGIGTAINIPDPSPKFKFASVIPTQFLFNINGNEASREKNSIYDSLTY